MYQTLNRARIPMYNVLFADIRTNSGIQLQWYLAPLLLELFVKIDSKRQIFSPSREFNMCDDQKFLISSPTLNFAPKRVCNVRIGTSPVLIDQIRPLEGLIGAGEPERENLFDFLTMQIIPFQFLVCVVDWFFHLKWTKKIECRFNLEFSVEYKIVWYSKVRSCKVSRSVLFISSSTAWFWKARAPDRNCGSALGPARLMRFFDVDYCQ